MTGKEKANKDSKRLINRDANMNKRFRWFNSIVILMVFMAFSAFGRPLSMAVMGFKMDDSSVEAMARHLPAMTKELQNSLAERQDVQIDAAMQKRSAVLSCQLQRIDIKTSVFEGTKSKAWNSKISIPVLISLQLPNGKILKSSFTLVQRLRSTTGEPQLDDKFCQEAALQIVSRCYDEVCELIYAAGE